MSYPASLLTVSGFDINVGEPGEFNVFLDLSEEQVRRCPKAFADILAAYR